VVESTQIENRNFSKDVFAANRMTQLKDGTAQKKQIVKQVNMTRISTE